MESSATAPLAIVTAQTTSFSSSKIRQNPTGRRADRPGATWLGRLVGRFELTGGVSANVFGLEIATSAGGRRRVVFRQHRSADFKQHGQTVTRREYGVLAALHHEGLAVPEPYLCNDSGAVTAPYLIIE